MSRDEQPVLLAANDSPPPVYKPSRDEKEYTKLLELYLGPTTGFLILLCCLAMKIPNGEEIATHLAMNQAEQDLVIEPLARLLDKQHFDTRVKTAILSSGDAIGLVLGLGAYSMRVMGALQELKGSIGHGQFRGTDAQTQAPVSGNGYTGNLAVAGFGQYQP